MLKERSVLENDLSRLAKHFREQAGKTRAQAAREMDVTQTSIFQAEEKTEQALLNLRIRMIEAYSPFVVVGPVFRLQKKHVNSDSLKTASANLVRKNVV